MYYLSENDTNNHRQLSVAFGLKISKSGALYVLFTLLIGFSAVNTGNNLLFLVVSGLLAFMSVTGLAGMYNIKKLIPDLYPPDEIYAGIPAPFRLSVRNNKQFMPSFLIRLEYLSDQMCMFPVLPKNSAQDGTVMITFEKRGITPIGVISISSTYPVGFFTRYWRFNINDTVTVFPHPILNGSSGNGDESPAAGNGLHRDRGISGELERIYPYSGSEPLRMIYWKHVARSHELLVKGFGRCIAAPLVINVDTLAGQGIEERLSRAAWLVQKWVRGRPVGLVLGNRTIIVGIGKQHGLMLLRELAVYGLN
ncbi:MAG: DUF58 domain-containing protein [Desulfuromonadaceae bacterium]|nr:DUF58 domain-containing protein [Desulfuromonadaceae bacterium]